MKAKQKIKMTEHELQQDAARYRKAHYFLMDLRRLWKQREITSQQYSTLRGQALSGDMDGAIKGLGRILEHNAEEREALLYGL